MARILWRAAALPSARPQRRSCLSRVSPRHVGSCPQHASRRHWGQSTRQISARPRVMCCRRTCSHCPRCQAAPSRRYPRPPAGHTARRASRAAQALPLALRLALAIVCQVRLSSTRRHRMRGMRRLGPLDQPQALSRHQCQAPRKHYQISGEARARFEQNVHHLQPRCFALPGLQLAQALSSLNERLVCLAERCQRLVALGGAPATPRAMLWRTCWRMRWTTCASRMLARRSWHAVQRHPHPRCWYELASFGYVRCFMHEPVQALLHGGWVTATGARASKSVEQS